MAEDSGLVDEVESTVRQAAAGAEVVVIRLKVGKKLSMPSSALAAELHRRFPQASLEIKNGAPDGSVEVCDIEVQ